jgi:hypothetical protein
MRILLRADLQAKAGARRGIIVDGHVVDPQCPLAIGATDKEPNGLFTRLFLREMKKPGVSVDRVLRSVRTEVARLARTVGHEQTPALYDQSLGDFFFKP